LILSESVGEIRVMIKEGIINMSKQKNKTPKFKIKTEYILKSSGTSET
jgi:predicted oxidoreductase